MPVKKLIFRMFEVSFNNTNIMQLSPIIHSAEKKKLFRSSVNSEKALQQLDTLTVCLN